VFVCIVVLMLAPLNETPLAQRIWRRCWTTSGSLSEQDESQPLGNCPKYSATMVKTILRGVNPPPAASTTRSSLSCRAASHVEVAFLRHVSQPCQSGVCEPRAPGKSSHPTRDLGRPTGEGEEALIGDLLRPRRKRTRRKSDAVVTQRSLHGRNANRLHALVPVAP